MRVGFVGLLLVQSHQLARLLVRQWSEYYGLKHAEYRGCATDPQSKRGDDDRREPGLRRSCLLPFRRSWARASTHAMPFNRVDSSRTSATLPSCCRAAARPRLASCPNGWYRSTSNEVRIELGPGFLSSRLRAEAKPSREDSATSIVHMSGPLRAAKRRAMTPEMRSQLSVSFTADADRPS